jgi:hypothetical protein
MAKNRKAVKKKPPTSGLASEMAADAKKKVVSGDSLKKISALAMHQLTLEKTIANAEKELKDLCAKLRQVSEVELPDAMAEVGMEEFKLKDGSKITVIRTFTGSISEKNREEAHNWLRANGHGSLIKHAVSVVFGKGQEKAAKSLVNVLEKKGLPFRDKEAVHPQTLQAFIREQMTAAQEEGIKFPQELFAVFPINKAKVIQK